MGVKLKQQINSFKQSLQYSKQIKIYYILIIKLQMNSITKSSNNNINRITKLQPDSKTIDNKLDDQFVKILTFIEQRYIKFNKHIQIRIEKWVEKLLLCDQNTTFRKRRNKYMQLLLEMITREFIVFMFLKMPPDEVPNITDSQYNLMMKEIKKKRKIQVLKHHQVAIRKIDQPHGDNGTCQATPCQTDRELIDLSHPSEIQHHILSSNRQKVSKRINQLQSTSKRKMISTIENRENNIQKQNAEDLMERIEKLLKRKGNQLQDSQNFIQLLQTLKTTKRKGRISSMIKNNSSSSQVQSQRIQSKGSNELLENQEQSIELKIQEGQHQINISDLGSPRDAKEMQFFKTLQL